jgi:hypothetical protein
LSNAVPPKALAPELQALWWAGKGDWDKAHRIVTDEHSKAAAWVHAYLHRVEGDEANAGYWYRQAQRKPATGSHSASKTRVNALVRANGPAWSRRCSNGVCAPARWCGVLAVNHENGQFPG